MVDNAYGINCNSLPGFFFHGCFIETFTNTFRNMPQIKLMFYIIKAWIHSHQFVNLWMPVKGHISFYFIPFP